MQRLSYLLAKQTLLQHFSSGLPIRYNSQLNGQFTLVSAALYNYLPGIKFQDHEKIFTNLHLHKKMSNLEQDSFDVLNFTTLENDDPGIPELIKNTPSIICTFHTGSYRLINLFLAKEKIPFSLVVGKKVIEREGTRFTELYNQFANESKGFAIIDAEASNSGLQMLRELKRGRNLLVYIDGNTGAGNDTKSNENNCIINFLNQQLFARKGVGFLAHAANVPVLPVICYRKSWTDIRLRFFKPVYPIKQMAREEFAQKIIQHLYDLVAPIIRQYPEQWEAWLYIHKVVNIINRREPTTEPTNLSVEQPGQLMFNAEQFGLYKLSGRAFIFQKSTYFSYPVSRTTFKILNECNSGQVEAKQINQHLLQQLYAKQLLVKCSIQ